jgi:Domain of unknown function (DUF5658)
VSCVTFYRRWPAASCRYNDGSQPLERRHKNSRVLSVNERKPATATLPPASERRRTERRQKVLRALLHGSFKPRRRGPRRADESGVSAVDWHHPQWLAIGILIVAFSSADALLTLMLIERGAYEMNPIMAPLVGGSALAFALVKVGLTAGGVVLLTQVARIRAFGRIPVGAFLYTVLALYGTLIAYEFSLLDAL